MSKKRFLKVKILLVMLCAFNMAHAQLKTITGTVKDEKGAPLANATVNATGAKAVKTAADGTFSIAVPAATTSLIVSNTEFKDKTVDITTATTVDVELTRNVTELSDVVVNVGYGTQKAKDVTGSISSVKGSDIKDLPVTNVADALQGRVSGVDVVQSNGEAGANTSQITIRGVSSLNQPAPLYVIDGVIQRPNPVANGGPTPGSNINPKDIASIDVLKDASATAIYGAAAAGGVIIITTKKGQGKPVINFSSRYGITTPIMLKMLDTAQYFALDKVTDNIFGGYTPLGRDTLANSDWAKALFSNGINQNYSLSVSGSSPAINYYMSGSYDDQKGIYLNNSSELYSFTINSDLKISDHLKIGEQINGYQRSTSPVDYATSGSDNPTLAPRSSPPFLTMPIQQIYGSTPGTYGSIVPNTTFAVPNPVAQILSKDRNVTQDNIAANVYAEAKFLQYFTAKATLGYTIFGEIGNSYNGTYYDPSGGVPISTLFKDQVSYKNLLNAYVLAFDKAYGNHFINALIGYEQYQGRYDALYTSETDVFPSAFGYTPTAGSILNISTGGYDPYPLVKSNFGRINYNYNGKYFATASVRRDADYIHFGPGDQAGIFPAFSAGWKMSDEYFMKRILKKAKISFLKLRGSYGEVGNSNIPAYKFLPGYGVINYSTNNSATSNSTSSSFSSITYAQSQIPNPNIHWEDTKEVNIGLDGEWLNGKVFYTVEWYNKATTGMLYDLPIPASSGFSNYYTNIGSTRDRGVDILLGYKDKYKELNYAVTFTGSFNTNLVEELDGTNNSPIPGGDDSYGPGFIGPYGNQALTRTAVGHPFGQFYGLKVLGIYQVGDPRLVNAVRSQNGVSPVAGDLIYQHKTSGNQITDSDYTYIGNPYPKFTYGLNLSLKYKGFDMTMQWNGVAGVDIYDGVASYSEMPFYKGSNTTSKVFNASLLGTNGVTNQPRIGRGSPGHFIWDSQSNQAYDNYGTPSSYFVQNGDYFKLKNLQIGYSFSNKLLERVHIRTARVFIMGNNILTITKYQGADPELGSQDLSINGGTTNRGVDGVYRYPNVRTYAAGVDLSF
jgi:TonB-dependent starch-binding outer membrane protein SusC